MLRYVFAAALSLTPMTAAADSWCDELWFTRNLIFDRAGYCFGSLLGQVTFDNGDCVTKSPALSADDKRRVALITEREDWGSCKVDAGRMQHEFADADAMRQLQTLPIRDDTESGCIGYLGAPITVRAGAFATARVIGQIERGDIINSSHIASDEGWDFVSFGPQDYSSQQFGWIAAGEDWFAECEFAAG